MSLLLPLPSKLVIPDELDVVNHPLHHGYADPVGHKVAGHVYQHPIRQDLIINPPPDFGGVDKWKHFESIGYTPHPGQLAFHRSLARFRITFAGSRWGKSCSAAREVEPIILTPNTNGWIVAPTYQLGEKEFRYIWHDLIEVLGLPTLEASYNVRQGNFFLRFPWGSTVEVKTAKVGQMSNLLGEELDWVIMAEAAEMHSSAWARYLRMRLHTRKGIAVFSTSPKGFGWVYKKAKLGNPPNSKWHAFYGDSRDNPHNIDDPDEDEMTKEDYNEQVKGIPDARGGRCFQEFSRAIHVKPCRFVLRKRGYRYYRCVDFGYTNPFVCLWYAKDHDGNYYFYREYYKKKELIDTHIKHIKGFRERIETTWADHDAKDRRAMWDKGIDTRNAKKDIEDGIRSVKRMFLAKHPHTPSHRRITIDPSCVELIRTLEDVVWQEGRENVKEIYVDSDNDPLDAMRYGVHSEENVGAWGI